MEVNDIMTGYSVMDNAIRQPVIHIMHLNHYAFSRTSQRSAKSWAELLRRFALPSMAVLTAHRATTILRMADEGSQIPSPRRISSNRSMDMLPRSPASLLRTETLFV